MVSVSRMAIFSEVGEDFEIGLNKANSSHTIFTNFTEQLLADGIIKWRFHSDTKDICVMNDYNPTTGLLFCDMGHVRDVGDIADMPIGRNAIIVGDVEDKTLTSK